MVDVLLKTPQQRLEDLETIVWGLPNLLNLRLEVVKVEIVALRLSSGEVVARLADFDRTITMLQTDVRDMRAGVTRQLLGQEERLQRMEAKLAEHSVLLVELRAQVMEHGVQLAEHSKQLADIYNKLMDNNKQLSENTKQLADNSKQLAEQSALIGRMATVMTGIDEKLDVLLSRLGKA